MAYRYEVDSGDAPPGYTEAASALNRTDANFTMQFADFAPTFPGSWGIFSTPQFDEFNKLMRRANDWLRKNPSIKVLNCESIELKGLKSKEIDYSSSYFTDYPSVPQYYLRILRIWYTIKSEEQSEQQQISYMNWVPRLLEEGSFLHKPKYESFVATVQRMNDYIREHPLQGKILTIESVDVKMSQKSSENNIWPDQSFWKDYGNKYTYYVQCLRVFVLQGEPSNELVGCADFVPECIKPAGVISKAEYENFYIVMNRASSWIKENGGIRLTNIQSVDCKMKRYIEGPVDSQRSLYRERTGVNRITMKLRFVRVCYTMPVVHPQASLSVTYKVFEPCLTAKQGCGVYFDTYESLPEVLNRMHAWFRATGAVPLCAETVPLRMWSYLRRFHAETTYSYFLGGKQEHSLYIVRVFILGSYKEPDPSLLPPIPVPQEPCCVIL